MPRSGIAGLYAVLFLVFKALFLLNSVKRFNTRSTKYKGKIGILDYAKTKTFF